MPPTTVRRWRTASTMLPLPASPFVRIIAAPSLIRRSASPRSRAPQTNGERKSCFQTWCSSSAGVSTSLSSMKSTPRLSRTRASMKWPMRTFAITGIETVRWMPSITAIEHMRATPPSLRMSDGTRSSAITAQAPASSAIFACSGVVTSMMTPPFSISARPTLSSKASAPVRAGAVPVAVLRIVLLAHRELLQGMDAWNLDVDAHRARRAPAARAVLAHRAPERRDTAADRRLVRGGDREAQAARRAAVVVELRARREEHAGARRLGQEVARVDAARQLDPDLVPAFRLRPRRIGQLARERRRAARRAARAGRGGAGRGGGRSRRRRRSAPARPGRRARRRDRSPASARGARRRAGRARGSSRPARRGRATSRTRRAARRGPSGRARRAAGPASPRSAGPSRTRPRRSACPARAASARSSRRCSTGVDVPSGLWNVGMV